MADKDASEEEIPPLEDMTDMLQQVEKMRGSMNSSHTANAAETQTSAKTNSSSSAAATQKKKSIQGASKNSFGGFKKGFLCSSSDTPKPQRTKTPNEPSDDMPFIKPANSDAKDSSLRLPEVQDALKLGESFAENKEWVTDDLLKNIEKSDILMRQMNNPRFMKAIQEFQTNPTSALVKYAGDKEMEDFLREFCSILGAHFENFTASKEKKKKIPPSRSTASPGVKTHAADGADISVRSSTDSKTATAEDEKKIQEILSDPELKDILLDPRIQKLLETLRTDPEAAQRVLQEGGSDIQTKVKKLVDAGVLGFQR